ncbi:MAG: ATP-binding cassette domain-containing protein [Bacteroidetes bacterium]|nr:ATP-binding cassette domain-containing protein [Bacteroidota bacterium]
MQKQQAMQDMPKAKLNAANFKKGARLFNYLGNQKGAFALGLLFLFLSAGVGLFFPLLSGKMFGMLGSRSNSGMAETLQKLDGLGLKLLLILLVQGFFSFGRVFMFTRVTENILQGLRNQAYERLIRKPMSFFSRNQSAELSSRLATDLNVISEAFTMNIAEIIRQTIVGVGGLTMILWTTKFEIAKWFLIIIPPLSVLAILFARKIRAYSKRFQDKIADANVIVGESLTGITNVKSFTNELFEIARFQHQTADIKKFGLQYGVFRGAFFAFVITCIFGAIFFMLYKMLQLNALGTISGEEFGQFMMLALFVSGSLGGLPEQIAGIQRALGATERVFEIIDEDIEVAEGEALHTPKVQGEIVFEDLSFHYPTRENFPVLKQISLKAEAGQTLALVGSSGSGKSTIANLLLRFYHPDQGRILLDGKNIADIALDEYRKQIAYVPQEVILFAGTIAENIAYGKVGATDAEVMDAARKANAYDFIMSFPEQWQTRVGERGIQLSGGQRQRIAIARAVLKDPAILILDEATSSLDSESEQIVQDALDRLMVGRTSIVIAHRLSTIRQANNIVVLHQGQIVETGTHEDLIRRADGFYRKLYQTQQGGELLTTGF